MKTKKRGEHSRTVSMKKKLSGLIKGSPGPIVESSFVDGIAHDFSLVKGTMKSEGLIKGWNLSRYDYYIIRLFSRVGTKPLVELNNLKKGGRQRLDSTAIFTA